MNEEKIEEGPLGTLALTLGLGAAPEMDNRPKKEPTHQVNTQQAQEKDSEIGYHQDDEWHKFGVAVDKELFELDANSAAEMAKYDALNGLKDNGVDISKGYRILKSGLGLAPGVVVVGVMK